MIKIINIQVDCPGTQFCRGVIIIIRVRNCPGGEAIILIRNCPGGGGQLSWYPIVQGRVCPGRVCPERICHGRNCPKTLNNTSIGTPIKIPYY